MKNGYELSQQKCSPMFLFLGKMKKFLNDRLKHLNLKSIYKVHTISFKTFFVWAFKIGVDTWKFNMLLLYTLRDDWTIFMISRFKNQLQQQLE